MQFFYLRHMPHYRITIKLEDKNVQEFLIEDPRTNLDFVYLDYRNRVYEKNGAGRVDYFDLVMLVDESVKQENYRKQIYKPFQSEVIKIPKGKAVRPSKFQPMMTLAVRAELARKEASEKKK